MRTRIDRIELVGVERPVVFEPGLNVVAGPISTGKSTLLRLCRILLGAHVDDLPPEVRSRVPALAGTITLGSGEYNVVRPLVGTDTAKVEIAGEGGTWRLPALRSDSTSSTTFTEWLLEHLGLPRLQVPAAPTRPADSATTPVSINDYMLYSHLAQEEIDSSVFGHRDAFKNIKRKYVFEITYGLYDVETASLQEQLRERQQELRQLDAGMRSFEQFLADTPWANRADIDRRLTAARGQLQVVEVQRSELASQSPPRAQALRQRITELDRDLAERRDHLQRERASVEQLSLLVGQLEAQSSRLTRSIVANDLFVDFDFRVCPRCGSDIDAARGGPDRCYLCMQQPVPAITRNDLVNEQERIGNQIQETRDLIAGRMAAAIAQERELNEAEAGRARVSDDLEAETRAFVSDRADRIAEAARAREELTGTVAQLTDYLRLYVKIDAARSRSEVLVEQVRGIQSTLDARMSRRSDADTRIDQLERYFAALVDEVELPRFSGEPRAAIDRDTYLPIVNGRSFGQLSSGGLKMLTNVAYALAHHESAVRQDLILPGILMLDNVTKNVGRDEYDWARVEAVFHALIRMSNEYGEQLQLIVSANDVPRFVEPYVRLRLSESNRLIPTGVI